MRTLMATLVYRLRERLRMPLLRAMVGMTLFPVLLVFAWAMVVDAPQRARPGVVVFATAELRDAFERDRRGVPTSLVVPPEGVPYLWVGSQAYETLELEDHGSAVDVAPYRFYVGNWLLDQRVDAVLGPPPTIDFAVETPPEANRLDADELAALAQPMPTSPTARDLIRPVIGWALALPGLMVGFIVAARLRTNVFLELGVGHRWGASSGEVMLGLVDAGVFTCVLAATTPEGFWNFGVGAARYPRIQHALPSHRVGRIDAPDSTRGIPGAVSYALIHRNRRADRSRDRHVALGGQASTTEVLIPLPRPKP